QKAGGRADLAGDIGRNDKDARADHRARDDRRGVEQGQARPESVGFHWYLPQAKARYYQATSAFISVWSKVESTGARTTGRLRPGNSAGAAIKTSRGGVVSIRSDPSTTHARNQVRRVVDRAMHERCSRTQQGIQQG